MNFIKKCGIFVLGVACLCCTIGSALDISMFLVYGIIFAILGVIGIFAGIIEEKQEEDKDEKEENNNP